MGDFLLLSNMIKLIILTVAAAALLGAPASGMPQGAVESELENFRTDMISRGEEMPFIEMAERHNDLFSEKDRRRRSLNDVIKTDGLSRLSDFITEDNELEIHVYEE